MFTDFSIDNILQDKKTNLLQQDNSISTTENQESTFRSFKKHYTFEGSLKRNFLPSWFENSLSNSDLQGPAVKRQNLQNPFESTDSCLTSSTAGKY